MKRFYIPIIALALLALPATAGAIPTFYSNHVPVSENTHVLGWGTLTFNSVITGPVTCPTVITGRLDTRQGVLSSLTPYECEDLKCETFGSGFLESVSDPIATELTTITLELTETYPARLKVGFVEHGLPIDLAGLCHGTGITWTLTGGLSPEWHNGSMIGAAPSSLRFNSGSLTVGGTGGMESASVQGSLKVMGSEGGELITVQ